jgi:hypothetical protein
MGGIKKFSTFFFCQIEKKDRKSNGIKKRREQETSNRRALRIERENRQTITKE